MAWKHESQNHWKGYGVCRLGQTDEVVVLVTPSRVSALAVAGVKVADRCAHLLDAAGLRVRSVHKWPGTW